MKRNWLWRGLKVVFFVALAVTGFSFIVMWLWNRLLPGIFGFHLISFWQALGLLVLSRILFGGFRGGRGFATHWRERMIERWEKMTPEERENFRIGMRRGCGPVGASPAAPKV